MSLVADFLLNIEQGKWEDLDMENFDSLGEENKTLIIELIIFGNFSVKLLNYFDFTIMIKNIPWATKIFNILEKNNDYEQINYILNRILSNNIKSYDVITKLIPMAENYSSYDVLRHLHKYKLLLEIENNEQNELLTTMFDNYNNNIEINIAIFKQLSIENKIRLLAYICYSKEAKFGNYDFNIMHNLKENINAYNILVVMITILTKCNAYNTLKPLLSLILNYYGPRETDLFEIGKLIDIAEKKSFHKLNKILHYIDAKNGIHRALYRDFQ